MKAFVRNAEMKDYEEERHYDAVELQVNAKNEAAYEMYVKCGFREKSINMVKGFRFCHCD